MKFPEWLKVYGDQDYRNKKCPTESQEQVTFVSRVRREYPDTWGKTIIHIRNEGHRTWGQAQWQKAEGMTKGAPDIVIPAHVPFLCEMKRQDHTTGKFQQGQLKYLEIAHNAGCFVCVALGYQGAWDALQDWHNASIRR